MSQASVAAAAAADDEYERVLLVKPAVYIYKIPPLTSASRGFRASDWNLGQPDWTGRLRVISKGDRCYLRIEDATSGQLYCEAPVLDYPGPQVQPVADSRRYFVVKVVSDTGRTALIGIGFADGADSFDLNVCLQDHFASLRGGAEMKAREERPKLDLALKGDTRMKLNINGLGGTPRPARTAGATPTSATAASPDSFILPPPPPGSKRR